ncbi:MAG TPA: thioredoxin family protein [Gemmatimonadales bacterium]|nr:thioredoxin family protein [Gemmatimonadales bacterium]
MLPLGTPMPAFALEDAVSGRTVSPADFADASALLVMFICNHCPYVQHVLPELAGLEQSYRPRGLALLAVNANDIEAYPADAPPEMARLARQEGWGFPFLFDREQDVARAFRAACTPDFFLFDRGRRLAYRGQLDDSRPGNGVPVTGRDLRGAIEAVLTGRPAPAEQRPSIGCSIKWKRGRTPAWFAQ